jgi:uncharacterized SAM-binding protein YcdF (DUF218 family)
MLFYLNAFKLSSHLMHRGIFKLLIELGKKISLIFSIGIGCWISGFVIFCFYFKTLTEPPQTLNTQALVVLTGDENRLSVAKNLFDLQFPRPLMHISGTNFEYWQKLTQKDPFSALISIDHASNTKENILSIKKWLFKNKIQSVRLVTSDYHMPRALLWTTYFFPQHIQVFPHPVRSTPFRSQTMLQKTRYVTRLFKEYNKYLITRIYFFSTNDNVIGI